MARLSFVLVLLVGLLAGGLGMFLLHPAPPPGLGDAEVRSIVAQIMHDAAPAPAPTPKVADLDPAQLDQVIEDYLLSDPTILQRMNDRLAERQQVAERAAVKSQLDAHYADIYQAPDNVVLGNPKGDVTLVEMFDYNCTYCRGALPDMATLMADDPNLRIILRQFPILSAGSVDAARIAVLVGEDP
ncbi:MAG: thioredoxin domain-containing protein, partial [Devosia sp.]